MPEIEELRQALESGDVSELLSDKEEQVMISSSLVTIPTYIKDPAKLPPDVLAMMINNKQTYDFLLQNFPDALKDIHSAENLQKNKKNQENAVDSKSPNKADTESKSVKLKRRVSSLIKGQNQKSMNLDFKLFSTGKIFSKSTDDYSLCLGRKISSNLYFSSPRLKRRLAQQTVIIK